MSAVERLRVVLTLGRGQHREEVGHRVEVDGHAIRQHRPELVDRALDVRLERGAPELPHHSFGQKERDQLSLGQQQGGHAIRRVGIPVTPSTAVERDRSAQRVAHVFQVAPDRPGIDLKRASQDLVVRASISPYGQVNRHDPLLRCPCRVISHRQRSSSCPLPASWPSVLPVPRVLNSASRGPIEVHSIKSEGQGLSSVQNIRQHPHDRGLTEPKHHRAEVMTQIRARNMAWFKRAVVWVTLCGPVPAAILARTANEGSGYTRLRFGLVCRGCYPQLNQARNLSKGSIQVIWQQQQGARRQIGQLVPEVPF